MSSTQAASMQFTPEWLKPGRKQPTKQPSYSSLEDEASRKASLNTNPPDGTNNIAIASANAPLTTTASYSSLLGSNSPLDTMAGGASHLLPPGHDPAHPFRYSKDQLLGVWRDGGVQKGVLGVEVARWPGIVRDSVTEPAGMREMSVEERKACSFIPLYIAYPTCFLCSATLPALLQDSHAPRVSDDDDAYLVLTPVSLLATIVLPISSSHSL
ncbi:hypothetical protein DL93DRAFT_1496001 [Clavulina sp. PMI_390]|nr:hypothetical protein DL93DRAFT_1496001 [Clavulina sp. PMI_390]